MRASGRNLRVVFASFLKDGSSGEIEPLKKIGVKVITQSKNFGWTRSMNAQTRLACARDIEDMWLRITQVDSPNLIILDEGLDALSCGFLSEEKVIALLNKYEKLNCDIALTGRDPPQSLIERADYISETLKIKHPFDIGVPARAGIEL